MGLVSFSQPAKASYIESTLLISGQTSRLLAPYVRRIVGVDISPKMVEVYNARVQHQGIPSAEMRAACFDILQDRSDVKLDESIGEKFDVIVVCPLNFRMDSRTEMMVW